MTTHKTKIYIEAAKQISMQRPLSEEWMEQPVCATEPFVPASDPSFRDYVPPRESRRMGKLIKRALTTSLAAMRETGISHPDAIITGTSIGSLDCTEKFLDALVENHEQALSPTYFMQSTHNTVGSAIAIHTKTHGYNTTYSHGACSFGLALQDAWMQMRLGSISNALVGGFDEMVPSYFELLRRARYVGQEGMVPCGEVSVSMVVGTAARAGNLCELAGIRVGCFGPPSRLEEQAGAMLREAGMAPGDVSATMTGVNGNAANDRLYDALAGSVFRDKPLLRYKHLFGENYTSPALGVYAAAHCLKRGAVPEHLCYKGRVDGAPAGLLLVNHAWGGGEWSLVLLRKI